MNTIIIIVLMTLYVVIARWIFKLPKINHNHQKIELKQSITSALAENIQSLANNHQGKSGIRVLLDGIDAFTMRMELIKHAEVSIDAQYYIWHKDLTGLMTLSALKLAAERGVKVRLLLDDHGNEGLDEIMAEMDAHENISIRLYNPFVIRRFKLINFTFDFFRLNRRMHNKAMIVDQVAAVSGGRNIGDEYFSTGDNAQFVDLDVLTVGQVLPSMIENFDLFYNSPISMPVSKLIKPKHGKHKTTYLDEAFKFFKHTEQHQTFVDAIKSSEIAKDIKNRHLIDEWTNVTMISDDPSKSQGRFHDDELMISRLISILKSPQKKIDIVTPYFVPGDDGLKIFKYLESQGVDIRVLTNAFEATDVMPVHSGYTKYRLKLLKLGVQLFEFKAKQSDQNEKKYMGFMGSSASSLHAKTFAVDDKTVFIGSFNFDPRSTMLNTEMGVLIESEKIAMNIHQHFDSSLAATSYKLGLNDENDIVWFEALNNDEIEEHLLDPNSSWVQRLAMKILGFLPIQWLL